jgi:hypothetical protein
MCSIRLARQYLKLVTTSKAIEMVERRQHCKYYAKWGDALNFGVKITCLRHKADGFYKVIKLK